MIQSFDRINESIEFASSSNKVIAFVNAADNGMTTFLLQELKSAGYIFVTQNYKGDIIIDCADKKASNFQDDRSEMFNIILNFEEVTKYSTNLLYFVPTFGTFLRNTYRDIFELMIKKSNEIKYSLDNFLSDYFLQAGQSTVFLIAEHIEKYNVNFLRKLKNIADKFPAVRLILTCDTATVSAEVKFVFNLYDTINFCKPNYQNAVEIFRGLKLDENAYDEIMYAESDNILSFIRKYNEKKKELNLSDPVDTAIMNILSYFDCYFNEQFLFKIIAYLKSCKQFAEEINCSEVKERLLSNRIISEQGDLYKFNLDYNPKYDTLLFNGFVLFLLGNYQEINCDVLYFILTKKPERMTSDILLHLALNYTSETALKEIVYSLETKGDLSLEKYCLLYAHLFNLKLFNLIPKYKGKYDKSEQNIINLLDTIAREKQHLKTSAEIYKKNIKKYVKTHNDFACLNEILFLDYAINHKRKYIKFITQKKSPYHITNFAQSKYYYLLISIAAFYLPDKNQAAKFYDVSISQATNQEKTLLINNKLAFQIMEFINENISLESLNDTFAQLSETDSFSGINYSFINHNIFLYESLTQQKNKFPVPDDLPQSTKTWELFKKLNYYTCKFVFEDLNIQDYIAVQHEVLASNRFPSHNFYYYNLFIIAKAVEDKKQIKIASKYLDHNKNFKSLDLYKKYKLIKNKPCKFFRENKQSLVKFGLIFSRLFDLDYLLKSIAEIAK